MFNVFFYSEPMCVQNTAEKYWLSKTDRGYSTSQKNIFSVECIAEPIWIQIPLLGMAH